MKDTNDLDKARESYEKAIELNPSYIDPYTNLAILFVSKKENKKAEDYFKKALHLSPKDVDLLRYFSDFIVE